MSGIVVLILRIAMTIVLYAFVAWALYTLWRNLQFHAQSLSSQNVPAIGITSLDSLDGSTANFQKLDIIIGRDPTCGLPVPHETVSARHARLYFHQSQWWLEDLNSTNGTYLNDERLTTPAVIVSGDEIRCGEKTFRVEISRKV